MSIREMNDVLAAAQEWNARREQFRREWLHDLAVEMAKAFEEVIR
jgi:hypothetical protein